MNTIYRVSVRELVEFILRSGDIDNRIESSADPDSMQEGSRIHRELQKSMPAGYRAEVTLSTDITDDDVTLHIEGRADGIYTPDGDDTVHIDEIKSVYAGLTYMKDARPVHLAQARCYAAIYAAQEGLSLIGVQMTYVSLIDGSQKRFFYKYSDTDCKTWFDKLVSEYMKWVHMQKNHSMDRDVSIEEMTFPYEYRPGQKEVATSVYKCIRKSCRLFIEAPTGVGKTLSTVYPTIKSMGEGMCSRVFYLTAKTVTGTVAIDTMKLLTDRGLKFRTVSITAKEKLCLNDTFDCNPDACEYARGHFDRVLDAVWDIVNHESMITRDVITEYAKKHMVCPYEFCLDISIWCDMVIADYNYAFDPRVKLRRYFSEGVEGDYVFLIDEAHNLPSRACEMYSASIVKEHLLAVKKVVKNLDKRLSSALDKANKVMLTLKKECDKLTIYTQMDELDAALTSLQYILSDVLQEHKNFDYREDVLSLFFEVRSWLDIYGCTDTGYKMYTAYNSDGEFFAKLLCIDPSANLRPLLEYARSSIMFSATLLPINYYKELITGDTSDYAIYAPSPFDITHRLLAIGSDVSSKYTRRTHDEYGRMASYVEELVRGRRGNYMVFFPSYEYMSHVAEMIENDMMFDTGSKTSILVQSSHMSESDRERFLSEFSHDREDTLLGLCVMGGIFAEGIDMMGDKLIGAAVVGTGLPMINYESEMMKEYFDEHERPGFDYAYRFPGMNKVLQAAGRVIRSDEDRGVILLLDDRFNQRTYRGLFPQEWRDVISTDIGSVADIIEEFWGKCDY